MENNKNLGNIGSKRLEEPKDWVENNINDVALRNSESLIGLIRVYGKSISKNPKTRNPILDKFCILKESIEEFSHLVINQKVVDVEDLEIESLDDGIKRLLKDIKLRVD